MAGFGGLDRVHREGADRVGHAGMWGILGHGRRIRGATLRIGDSGGRRGV
jgi:hypothetical protein